MIVKQFKGRKLDYKRNQQIKSRKENLEKAISINANSTYGFPYLKFLMW